MLTAASVVQPAEPASRGTVDRIDKRHPPAVIDDFASDGNCRWTGRDTQAGGSRYVIRGAWTSTERARHGPRFRQLHPRVE